MKTKITLGMFAILFALFITNNTAVIANSGGSPGGYSSSMGDGGNSCGQGGCHGGGHTIQNGIIVTNIPMTGYTPGSTYSINVGGKSGSGSKFGFELAAENSSNVTAGTIASTNTRTQIRSNGQATHTSSGNAGSSGNFGWALNWTAPASGSGTVTFSTAVLVANNNGMNTGDNVIRFSTSVNEASTSSLSEINPSNTKLYPNPVENYLNIFSKNSTINSMSVMNIEGKIVLDATIASVDKIDLTHLEHGVYFVTVKSSNSQFTQKILKM